jgi:hypothetical protein
LGNLSLKEETKMVSKVSEITTKEIADYIRLDDYEESEISTYLNIAKSYISSYTGISVDNLDEYADFIIVVYVLCQDMYDNRTMYVESGNLNKVVQTILDMHTMNNL